MRQIRWCIPKEYEISCPGCGKIHRFDIPKDLVGVVEEGNPPLGKYSEEDSVITFECMQCGDTVTVDIDETELALL